MSENTAAGNQFGAPPPPPAPKTVTALDVAAAEGRTQNLNAQGERNALHSPRGQAGQEEKQAGGTITEVTNPASSQVTVFGVSRESRVSMNTPSRKLETPDIPGYHLHWFLEQNIPRAIHAGYEYVGPKELPSMDRSIGGRPEGRNSDSLGGNDRISAYGGLDVQGNTVTLTLMKIRLDWYFDDQKVIASRNLSILQMIFAKKLPIRAEGESEADYGNRYTRESVIDMSNGRFKKR